MNFTYTDYEKLLEVLRNRGYSISEYKNYDKSERTVILRHDVDISLEKAVEMAQFEKYSCGGAQATYFILVSSDFYNVFSGKSMECIKKIVECGHQIGLHFDEKRYFSEETWNEEEIICKILQEKELLEKATGIQISSVSMHTPTKRTLEADLQIPGMINSYDQSFFKEFRYISDSFHRWRENVWDVIENEKPERLHILTHAFWYHEESLARNEVICRYIEKGGENRYKLVENNILPPGMKLADCLSDNES